MKKIFVLGIIVGAILALGGLAFAYYNSTTASAADTPSQTFAFGSGFGTWGGSTTFQGRGPGGPGFGPLDGQTPLGSYVEAAVADILGISVEDLQAAKEAGTRMPELLDNAGLTADEFQAAMEEAVPGIVEQALADGVITQAQADFILENGLRGAKGYLHSALQEYVDAAVADILGVTVEDLQAAREDGTVADLLAAAGLTPQELRTALEEAAPGIVEQALEDGVITQAQADFILENGLRGLGGFGPGDCMGGPGGRGLHGGGPGGFGPGGFGPGNQNAPATDTSSGNG